MCRYFLAAIIICLFVLGLPSAADAAPKELEGITQEQAIAKLFGDRELDPIEGIWVMEDGQYTIAITQNKYNEYTQFRYVGILISDTEGRWKAGSIKIAFNGAPEGRVFLGIWRGWGLFGARPEGRAGFRLLDANTIMYRASSFEPPEGALLRIYPSGSTAPKQKGVAAGTGFFITTELVATNDHVITKAKQITVVYDGRKYPAEVVAKDPSNDVAILRVSGLEQAITALPLGDPVKVSMGETVFTYGFPLPDLMGINPKAGEGIINSLSGMKDDLRLFQISIPVQPGNSGGPLLNRYGQVIGIVSSGLNALYTAQHKGVVPQNVNYAVKIAYLINISPVNLPYSPAGEVMPAQQVIQNASKAVVFVIAEQ